MLGSNEKLKWRQTHEGLIISWKNDINMPAIGFSIKGVIDEGK